MILIDANLLIYAVNSSAPDHREARAWLDLQLSEGIDVGLPWLVLIAFLRIVTHPRIFAEPLPLAEAERVVSAWLQLPNVTTPLPREQHWAILSRLLARSGTGGNLTNDAHLGAIAIEHGALLCSADNDFRRFQGVQHFNPLAHDEIHEPMTAYLA